MTKPTNNVPVLIARVDDKADVEIAAFIDGDDVVIANAMPQITMPFGEKRTAKLGEGAKVKTMAAADLNGLPSLGKCCNPNCSVTSIVTSPECAAELKTGDVVHCVACGHAHAITGEKATLADLAKPATETPPAASSTPAPETAKKSDDEDDDEGDDDTDIEDESDDNDDEDAGDDDTSDDNDEEDDEDDDEEDDEDEEEDASAIDLGGEEIASLISSIDDILNEKAEKPAAETASTVVAAPSEKFEVNLTSSIDFDVESIKVVPVTPEVAAVFATAAGKVTNIGMLSAETASVANKSLFSKNDMKTLETALRVTVQGGGNVAELGFNPIVHTVDLPTFFADKAKEQATAEVASSVRNNDVAIDEFSKALATVSVGMTKRLYENPLIASLTTELARRGVQQAERVATSIVTASADEYMRHAIVKAKEFMAVDPVAREAMARLVKDARQPTPEVAEFSQLPVATASLVDTTVREVAGHMPQEAPQSKVVKRMFKVR